MCWKSREGQYVFINPWRNEACLKEVDSKHMKRNLSESAKERRACNESRLVWTPQIPAKDSDGLTSRCSTIILWSARKTCWSRTEDKCHAWVPSKHRREEQTSALKYSIIKLSILQFFKIIHFIILERHYKLEMENVLSFSLHWI